jgi:D-aminopeptidase
MVPRTTHKMIYRMKILLDQHLDPLYEAAIEATEEAILNSLCMAREMEGVSGNFAPALPLQETKELLDRWKLRPRSPKVELARPSAATPQAGEGAQGQRGPERVAPDPPTVAEAPPSAVRGAEGMMVVPIVKDGGE